MQAGAMVSPTQQGMSAQYTQHVSVRLGFRKLSTSLVRFFGLDQSLLRLVKKTLLIQGLCNLTRFE